MELLNRNIDDMYSAADETFLAYVMTHPVLQRQFEVREVLGAMQVL